MDEESVLLKLRVYSDRQRSIQHSLDDRGLPPVYPRAGSFVETELFIDPSEADSIQMADHHSRRSLLRGIYDKSVGGSGDCLEIVKRMQNLDKRESLIFLGDPNQRSHPGVEHLDEI
jgi:hypothetical protein